MSLRSWRQWQGRKVYLEFVGPKGQPDPSGVSPLVLQPGMANPAEPTMGTRPGMSLSFETTPKFEKVYDQFIDQLKKKNLDQQKEVIQKLMDDLGVNDSDEPESEDDFMLSL